MKQKIHSYADAAKVNITEMPQTSEEVGALCKKTFAITVAAIKKSKE